MRIKIIKEKRVEDYTFIDGSLNLGKSVEESDSDNERAERSFRLMDNAKINKLRKSRITGGHSKQGHSAVYE
jgi:hypothetical protein